MPPWMPDPTHGASAAFERVRRLSDKEIALIAQWREDGYLEGAAAADRPALPALQAEWTLGPPDLIVKAEPYTLAADGGDVFRTFVAKVPLTNVRYVRAFEFRAGNANAVHHANIKVDRTDSSRVLDLADAGPGYEGAGGRGAIFPDGHFLGWTPGQSTRRTTNGLSWTLLPAGDLVFELHMMPTGKPEIVEASIGLYFTDEPPQRLPVMIRLGRQDIDIPAGRRDYVSQDSYVLPTAASVLALQPHAHRIATTMRAWATRPDGSIAPLISIPHWNMSWQDTYVLQRPLWLPAGSRLSMSFTYDNSVANPRSPAPGRRVTFGQTTRSEMGDLWVQVMPDSEQQRPHIVDDVSKMMLRADIAGVETMLAVGPDDARLRTDLGFCYLEAGRGPEAVEQLRHATRLTPDSAAARHDLATVLLRQRRYGEAREELQTAIRLRPNFFEAYVNLGVADFAEGRPAPAIDWYQRSLAIEPDNATAHYNLAGAYASLRDFPSAERHYARAIALGPRDIESLLGLARLLALQGRTAAAADGYRKALAIDPRTAAALLDLSWVLSTAVEASLRDPKEAIRLADQALNIAAAVDLPTSLDVLAAAFAADGQTARAMATARQALLLIDKSGGPRKLREAIAQRLATYEILHRSRQQH